MTGKNYCGNKVSWKVIKKSQKKKKNNIRRITRLTFAGKRG